MIGEMIARLGVIGKLKVEGLGGDCKVGKVIRRLRGDWEVGG